MRKDRAMALCAALRSGLWDQVKNGLHHGADGYCCLGVACDLAGVNFRLQSVEERRELELIRLHTKGF